MSQLTLPVLPGTLPSGACPSTLQDTVNLFASVMSVQFPTTFSGVTTSSTSPADTTQAWLRLDASGRPVGLYWFASGAWLSPHPMQPGMTIIWTTALPNLNIFDGGDANPVSAVSGPMWEVVLSAVFPLAAGTFASGKVVAIGDLGGEEKHVLTIDEIAPIIIPSASSPTGNFAGQIESLTPTFNKAGDDIIPGTPKNNTFAGDPASGTPPILAKGHDTVPPYQGVAFLRRTARLFFVA